jgi:transcription elongation factor GreA
MHKKVYVTKDGLEELKLEHDEIVNHKRPDLVERLAAAREMGDLSENAEYHAAREELAFLDGRIDELQEMLKQAILIKDEPSSSAGNQVKLGSNVTMKCDGKEVTYSVVGELEANPAEKRISHESPLGKALMNKKIGEVVAVKAPARTISYTIVSIN